MKKSTVAKNPKLFAQLIQTVKDFDLLASIILCRGVPLSLALQQMEAPLEKSKYGNEKCVVCNGRIYSDDIRVTCCSKACRIQRDADTRAARKRMYREDRNF